jgi:hypothetical protein
MVILAGVIMQSLTTFCADSVAGAMNDMRPITLR